MSLYFQSSEEKNNTKIILGLLEKAEQILSIINLPETTIHKYNHLKEITFEKLNLEFKPLTIKRNLSNKNTNISSRNINTTNSNICDNNTYHGNNHNNTTEQLIKLRSINTRKNVIIEYLFDLMEKFKFENNNYMRQYFNDNQNFNLYNSIENALGNMNNLIKSANFNEDFDFELKLEELKLKDFIGKSDICYRKFLSNLKNFNTQIFDNYTSNYINNGNINKNYNNSNMSIEEVVSEYERKIDQIKWDHEEEIKEYHIKFNELRLKYNPELEGDYNKLRESYDIKTYILNETNSMVDPIYEKYYSKNVSWYEKIMLDFKYEELTKIHFITSLVNKFFSDNKYLLDMVGDVQKEKAALIEERNLPFVLNAIQKNSTLIEIQNDLPNLEKNNDLLYKNIDQVLEYMSKNIENLV